MGDEPAPETTVKSAPSAGRPSDEVTPPPPAPADEMRLPPLDPDVLLLGEMDGEE